MNQQTLQQQQLPLVAVDAVLALHTLLGNNRSSGALGAALGSVYGSSSIGECLCRAAAGAVGGVHNRRMCWRVCCIGQQKQLCKRLLGAVG